MLNYPTPEKPWERIHLDTLELPLSENWFQIFTGNHRLLLQILHFAANTEQEGGNCRYNLI